MVKWPEVFSRAVYLLLTTAVPGYVIGVTVDSGHVPYWGGIVVSLIAWVMALAYGLQRKRITMYRLAITRMQAKQDANVTYLIQPEDIEVIKDETD